MDFTYTFSSPIRIKIQPNIFTAEEIVIEKNKDKSNIIIFKINFYDKTNNKHNYLYMKSSGKMKAIINENKFLLFYTSNTRLLFIYNTSSGIFEYINALYYKI